MRGGTTRNPRVRRRRKRRTAKTPRRTTTLCSASTPSPGHSEISTPRSFLGFVRPPRLFMHLGWGADELAWAALNREQQSSLLVEPRELPDIENYSIQEFLCRRSAEDPTTVLALLRRRTELVLKRPHLEGPAAAMTSGAARSNLLRWLLGSRDLKLEDHVTRSQPTSSSARSGPTAANGRVTDDQ
jgi:hypothetical protein